MNEKIVNKLEQFPSATPSRWREKAEERRESEAWRRESRRIALMMLDRLEALGMSQADLAARLGCTQQYVSRILKGHENLSLKTICKIDDVLSLAQLQRQKLFSINFRPDFGPAFLQLTEPQ